MTHLAGQMLPAGDPRAVSPHWVPANGLSYPKRVAGDYYRRWGKRGGFFGIYRIRTPSSPGWVTLLRDDPTQPDIPGAPTVSDPPRQPPAVITINTIPDGAPGATAVSGTVGVAGTPVQAAFNNNGIIGAFTAMTVTGSTWSGSVTVATNATMRIRARQTAVPQNFVDSNAFSTAGLQIGPRRGRNKE